MKDGPKMDELVNSAVAKAIEEHRRAGRSIIVWRDGKIVEIPAEEIPVLEEEAGKREKRAA